MESSLRDNQTILSEIERMPEAPPRQRISHHRRARSDTFFSGESIDDLLLFNASDVDFSSLDFLNAPTPQPPPPPQPQQQTQPSPMSVDSPSEETSSNGALPPKPEGRFGRHVRSFSVDSESDFFDDLAVAEDNQFAGKSGERKGHHRSNSMDGATSSGSFNMESILAAVNCKDGAKKNMGMASDRLAELALLDPKRAKRILANRQSAARSKERKIRYTGELERKVQTLQNEATTLSAQVTVLQRGTSDLNIENKHLKMRLQALEQQAELRDALNEALREELNRLKIAAGEIPQGNGNSYNRAQFSSQQSTTMHQFGNNNNKNPPSQQQRPSFMDFTKRG